MRSLACATAVALGICSIWLIRPASTAHAQTTGQVFTSLPTANNTGTVIVDQSTGAVTFCASSVKSNAPDDGCILLGRATPSSGYPESLTMSASASTVYILNNVTGAILQCSTLETINNGYGSPTGSCVSLGSAKT